MSVCACMKEPLEPAGYSALLDNSVLACCRKLLLLPHLPSELPRALQRAVLALPHKVPAVILTTIWLATNHWCLQCIDTSLELLMPTPTLEDMSWTSFWSLLMGFHAERRRWRISLDSLWTCNHRMAIFEVGPSCQCESAISSSQQVVCVILHTPVVV